MRDVEVVACDGSGLLRADAVAVEALARLQLTARRLGARIVLHGASDELRELIELMGLSAPMNRAPSRGPTS